MKEENIFHAALEKPPEQQAKFIADACGDDAELRQRVEILLYAHANPGSFLGAPVASAFGDENNTVVQSLTEKVGDEIGPFLLRERLGEGGMGVVYVAEQKAPVRRKVALKIIKPGMDTLQVIARFEAERQALALMDHPNIAKVIDGGSTEAGRPYFVMELIRGQPVTKYCDQVEMSTTQRLELFISICNAVQHAHQKGIIHRDLKPNNVLETEIDGKSIAKVIDFGVAKAINQQLSEQTIYTNFAQMIGTPLYMSPEQASVSGVDVDTRSDVYSLGVLLYEMLSGSTPFDQQEMRDAGFDEIRRIIREVDPPNPSTRFSTLKAEDGSTVSKQRGVQPRRLKHIMEGELDWIVMKAMDKDRGRRYESASAFAQDIRRYLDDEPVEACPPTINYRARKFALRNKVFITTTALVLISLLVGTTVAAWQAWVAKKDRNLAQIAETKAVKSADQATQLAEQAKQSEAQAKQSETKAKQEAAIAKAVIDFLQIDLLGSANPAITPDAEVKLRTILDRAAIAIEGKFVGQPLVEAAIRDTIGQAYFNIGNFLAAEPHQARAAELAVAELGIGHSLTLTYQARLGKLWVELGRFKEAEALLRPTLKSSKQKLGDQHPDTASNMIGLARALSYLEQNEEAEKLDLAALEVYRNQFGPEDRRTLQFMSNLALGYQLDGRTSEAEELHLETLETQQRVLPENDRDSLRSMSRLASTYFAQERYEEWDQQFLKTIELQERLLGIEDPDTVESKFNLATDYMRQGRLDEAEKMLHQTTEIRERTLGKEHPKSTFSLNRLAALYVNTGRNEQAEEMFFRILEIRKRTLGDEHTETIGAINNVMFTHLRRGNFNEVKKLVLQIIEIQKRTLGIEHSSTIENMRLMANVYGMLESHAEAEAILLEVIEVQRKLHDPEHPAVLLCESELSNAYLIWGWILATAADPAERDTNKSVVLARQALELYDPDDEWHQQQGASQEWHGLGVALCSNGEYEEAVEALEKADVIRKGRDRHHRMFLAISHWQLGNQETALKYYAQGAAFVDWQWHDADEDLEEVTRFRLEAERVMNLTEQDRTRLIAQYYADGPNDDPEFLYELGQWHRTQGQHAKAIDALTAAIAADPNSENMEIWRARAVSFLAIDKSDEALLDYAQVMKLTPQDITVYFDRAKVYRDQKKFELALEDLQAGVDVPWQYGQAERAVCYILKGDILSEDLKRFEPAVVEYTKAIELQPESAAILEKRAKALRENGETEKALADEQEAARLRAEQVEARKIE